MGNVKHKHNEQITTNRAGAVDSCRGSEKAVLSAKRGEREKMMSRRSSTFFRLEKNIGDGYKSVYEFHTVVNGNMYIREHEEKNGEERWLGKSKPIYNKEAGNNMYLRLCNKGYKFAGKYEMDILGYKKPLIEEVK